MRNPPSSETKDTPRTRFAELLRHHMQVGTRPAGKRGTGAWSVAAFANAIGVSQRTVQHYTSGKTLPPDVSNILAALFDEDDRHSDARAAFLSSFDQARGVDLSSYLRLLATDGNQPLHNKPIVKKLEEPDDTLNFVLLALAVGKGIIIKLRGETRLTKTFLEISAKFCSTKRMINATVSFDPDAEGGVTGSFVTGLIMNSLKQKVDWTWDAMAEFVNNCLPRVLNCLLEKAYELQLLDIDNNWYVINRDTLNSFGFIFAERVMDIAYNEKALRILMIESWKELITSCHWTSPQEDQVYKNTLSVLMYALAVDSGMAAILTRSMIHAPE